MDIQIQEEQKIPNKMNPKKSIQRYIIIKLSKDKDKKQILKTSRENKLVMHKGSPINCQWTFQQKCCMLEGMG